MFIQLVRVYIDSTTHHSVQFFNLSDYDNSTAWKQAATARYHNILAADLGNSDVVYNACYMIDSNGVVMDKDVFDRRESEA